MAAAATTQKTRAGAIAIGGAKAFFLIAGLAQNALLPLAIGQGGFGAYKRALTFVNVLNNVIVAASLQAVSRAVVGSDEAARASTLRKAVALHALIGLVLGGLFVACVPLVVENQHAPHLATPLRVMAVVLVAYGVYAPMVGGLNGVGAFGAQAALDATYSTLRTALSVGVGYLVVRDALGQGVTGASLGFVAAALVIVPIAWVLTRTRVRGDAPSRSFDPRAHLAFLAGVMVMQAFQSLLLQVDLMILGRVATVRALAAGSSEAAARAGADALAGLYAQAQAFGLVPYQLLIAATLVLFPAVAGARARGDVDALRSEVARGGRATVVIAGALVAAIGGTPLALLRFVFGDGAKDALPTALAAPILRVLAIAHGGTAIAIVGITLIAAAGRDRVAALLAAVVAACALGGAWCFATWLSSDAGAALGVALSRGLLLGIFVGAFVVAVAVRRMLGPYLTLATTARVGLALGATLAAGAYLPTPASRLLCVLVPIAPLVVYVAIVWLLGERPTTNARPADAGVNG